VMIKRLVIGPILPGLYSLHSVTYLRYWFLHFLMNNTRHLVLPIYATLLLPQLLRWLGAKIGPNVEISTALHIMPDLLAISEGSFLADACIVGGHRVHRGFVDICGNKIGTRTFVGNSALVPAGIDIGDNGLLGVMSLPPAGVARTPDGTRWLGSPSFELPVTQQLAGLGDHETFSTSGRLVRTRLVFELLRIFLPGIVAMASLVAFCVAVALGSRALPLWGVVLMAPVGALALSVFSVVIVAGLKRLL